MTLLEIFGALGVAIAALMAWWLIVGEEDY